jgi:hypothetical protein
MSDRRRRTHFSLAATLIALAAGSVVACGDSSNDSQLLSPTSASELRSTLAQVEQTVENGDCGAAQEQVDLLERQVTSLNRVEADLRDALASGVGRLQQLVIEGCQTSTPESGTTGTTGPSETGGATGPEETESGAPGKSKGKGKKKGHLKDDQAGSQPDTGDGGGQSGGSGDAGTTGSGGSTP